MTENLSNSNKPQCSACLDNSSVFKTLDIDDANKTLSLRKLCFKSLSKYSSLFSARHLCYLPIEILEDFKWYLSVHDLLRYSNIFKQAGISTTSVWEQHFLKRYGQRLLRRWYFEREEHHVSEENCQTFQAQFLQYHCSELLSSSRDIESDCKCLQNLCFYLQFTPSLVLRWLISGELKRKLTSDQLKQSILENVQHLHIFGIKGKTYGYEEVAFLKSCKQLKSIYFKNFNLLSWYFCCEEKGIDKPEENKKQENSLISLKAILGEEDINFLTSDKFSESGIKRLNIMSYERILSGCQLSGKGWCDTALRKLTHLTLTGEILSDSLVNELICGLFEVFRDPLREPMKCLCLVFNGQIRLQFDAQKFAGQTYAVEEFELLNTEIEKEETLSMLVQFLQCNRSLSHLNIPTTSINLPQYSAAGHDGLMDVIVKSRLRFLATPVVSGHGFNFDVFKILSNSSEMSFLKVQGSSTIEHMQEFVTVLARHKYIRTLSLQEIILGAAGKDILISVLTSENSHLSNLDLRFCGIEGEDFITAAKTASESRVKHKLHVLDISMNKINRQQQTTIKMLYKNLTDILMVDIPDRPQMEFVAQM